MSEKETSEWDCPVCETWDYQWDANGCTCWYCPSCKTTNPTGAEWCGWDLCGQRKPD